MRRHPTPRRSSTAAVVTVTGCVQLVAEDEIAITSEAAVVLARIVREHLEQTQPSSAPSAVRRTAAAH